MTSDVYEFNHKEDVDGSADGDKEEAWDELEKSIIAKLADDVIVGVLSGKADIVIPNMTEASFMLGIPYRKSGYDVDYVKKIMKDIAALGAKKVVLKGIEFEAGEPEIGNVAGKIGVASYDSLTGKFSWYFHEKIPQNFHGTGDIFASVFTGAMLRGMTLEKSYALAADFVVESIKETLSHEDHNWYGVDFEAVFPYLWKRLENNN